MDIAKYTRDYDTGTNMDDTEDEEVKRNCFGMKHYETSSEEESDEEESSDLGSPIKFSCGNPSERGVLKPTPMTLQRVLEQRLAHPKKGHKKIIHNECEFSEDEEASGDEESRTSINELTHYSDVDKEASLAKADDYESDATDDTSEDEEAEDDLDQEEVSYVDETMNNEEESLQGDGDASVSSFSDADDESSENDEEEDAEETDQGDTENDDLEEEDEAKVIVDWGEIEAGNISTDLVSKVSSSSVGDNDTVSAEDIEDFIGKPEASEMCFSDTEVNENDYDIMECLVDTEGKESPQAQCSHPQKRNLSVHIYQSESEVEGLTCKRSRLEKPEEDQVNGTTLFPILYSDGISHKLIQRNRDSPQFSGSATTEEEAVDYQLAEELIENMLSDKPRGKNDPVPLLTRPSSPIVTPVSSISGQVVCDWPSNLAVDNALTAAISLRPMSPSSLMKLEEQEKNDFLTPTVYPEKRLRSVSEISTGLTPMLCSLSMPRV